MSSVRYGGFLIYHDILKTVFVQMLLNVLILDRLFKILLNSMDSAVIQIKYISVSSVNHLDRY